FRHLRDDGKLVDAQGAWRRDFDAAEVDVPAGERAVIGHRLERIYSRTRDVLTTPAGIGPIFERVLFEGVFGCSGAVIAAALEWAEQAHLVKGPSGRHERRWRFAQQMIRQVLASDVPRIKRQKLHARTAEVLRAQGAESGSTTSEIAHHLYNAGAM